jgi:DNA-binding transcriptional MerR regulator
MTGPAFTFTEPKRETTNQTISAHLQNGKSPSAYRTISEAADELAVPQHVLRFWETKFSQIRPMKRSGGRRFYRPEDIELLQTIKTLLYDQGYTIKGVQRLLKLRRGLQEAMASIEQAEIAALPTVEVGGEEGTPAVEADAVDLTDTADVPDDLFATIPDHLPAKPASLMAQGLMEGNPLPPTAPTPAQVAAETVSGPPVAALSAEKRLQLQAMLAELKALKSLLN